MMSVETHEQLPLTIGLAGVLRVALEKVWRGGWVSKAPGGVGGGLSITTIHRAIGSLLNYANVFTPEFPKRTVRSDGCWSVAPRRLRPSESGRLLSLELSNGECRPGRGTS